MARNGWAGSVPLLSENAVLAALKATVPPNAAKHFHAFFSSELEGIVTDPSLMVLSIDDHMVHRGHAVFDTASLIDGSLYQLDAHLDRILGSAQKAKIISGWESKWMPLTNVKSASLKSNLREIIFSTVIASKKKNAEVRYWIGAGRGGFALTSKECARPTFYCMVYTPSGPGLDAGKGWAVKTSPVPPKDDMFATIKSNNYLPNALNAMDAEAEGFNEGVFVDAEGYVCEGPAMNIGFILKDGTLVIPPFDKTLAGVTIRRVMSQLPMWKERNAVLAEGIKEVQQRPISVEEAKGCAEAFMAGSTTKVMPVVRWDDLIINGGKPGPLALAMRAELDADMIPSADSEHFTPVPYPP